VSDDHRWKLRCDHRGAHWHADHEHARPSGFDGSLAVDLRSIDTGIALRNDHLREKYLEVDKGAGYEQAVLSDVSAAGVNADAPTGKGSFTGSLMLHGVKKTVTGPWRFVRMERAGVSGRHFR
jgi:polyisoprenoid-binding protein YceI